MATQIYAFAYGANTLLRSRLGFQSRRDLVQAMRFSITQQDCSAGTQHGKVFELLALMTAFGGLKTPLRGPDDRLRPVFPEQRILGLRPAKPRATHCRPSAGFPRHRIYCGCINGAVLAYLAAAAAPAAHY